ncbi:MAG: type II toxin-antitoxin system Phd/YefM family antitoxin [Elusimicrobia bacterium]|nr:type II toxin-antitoxin system Phd/YefM family antitoxin [Elusimicrobiota bacterium]
MLNIQQDIHSLTDFKRHTVDFVKQLKKGHRPLVLTVNGRAEVVVQDAESYQKLLEIAESFEAISAVQEGMAQAERGEGVSLERFDKRMRKKHGISR